MSSWPVGPRLSLFQSLVFPDLATVMSPSKGSKLLALDTEDDSGGEPKIINFYDGHRHTTFQGDDLQIDAWNWLASQSPATVWACNVEYDLINLFGAWVGKMVTLNYRGSAGLLRGSMRDTHIQFFDTYRHWPMSVEQMGRYLGMPKMEKDFESVKYCRQDTAIVWHFVEHMLERYRDLDLRLRSTLPSMALQLFERFYGEPWPDTGSEERAFFRDGYYGGRVEVYQFGLVKGPMNHYDVNSLFPSVMKANVYPDVSSGFISGKTIRWDHEGMADVTIVVPECAFPPLPIRGGNELVYPYGVLRGVWAYPELRAAIMRGAKIITVHKIIEYPPLPMGRPFASYIDYCYGQRRQSRHDLDRVFWKLMMNSLYGKFGQGEGLVVIFNDKEMTFGSSARQANVIWAAYVTSHARVRLLELLESTRKCYYTDTDSLFTPDTLTTSMRLGQLKWEGTADRAQFYGNKLYVLWDYDSECGQCKATGRSEGRQCEKCRGRGRITKKELIKAKGVPPEAAGDFIRTGRSIYRKPVRYRESRRSFAQANVWLHVEKERDDLYTKRRVFGSGATWPWQWNVYQKARDDETLTDPKTGGIGLARTKVFDWKPKRRYPTT